jgi:hypothetical protein
VLAENILLKQQLLVLQRSRRRAPNLRSADRFLFGFCSQFLSPRRLIRTAIILKPATLLRFHRGFKDFKYRFLCSSSPKQKPGPKGPSPELIRAICELKRRNPRFGCPKIACSSIAGFLAANPGWDLPSNATGRGTPGLIGLGAGAFACGTYTINNIGNGANAEYFLIGWTGSAATADAAIAGWNGGQNQFGESAIAITATTSLLGFPDLPIPVNLRGTFGGMVLLPLIPEPSCYALAGLGLAALLIFRRGR